MNNEDIVYVDEKVSEKVYEGVWALDMPWLSEDEQKMRILEMMEKDTGIHVDNPDEYTIGYVGAEDHYNDDNNTYDSETQVSRFVVTHETIKKVPYKEKREEVYSGTYILEGPRISPEEQKQRILNEMASKGISIDNPDELEIGYVGAEDYYNDDNNTYDSETQTSRYVVYRVTRERLEDDNLNNIDFEPIENDAQVGPMDLEMKPSDEDNRDYKDGNLDARSVIPSNPSYVSSVSLDEIADEQQLERNVDEQIRRLTDLVSQYSNLLNEIETLSQSNNYTLNEDDFFTRNGLLTLINYFVSNREVSESFLRTLNNEVDLFEDRINDLNNLRNDIEASSNLDETLSSEDEQIIDNVQFVTTPNVRYVNNGANQTIIHVGDVSNLENLFNNSTIRIINNSNSHNNDSDVNEDKNGFQYVRGSDEQFDPSENDENLRNKTVIVNPIDDVNNDTTDEENEEEENLNNETGNLNPNEDDNNDTTDEENEEEDNLNNETGNLNPNEDDNNDTTDEENEEEDNLNNETGNLNPNEDDNNDTTDEENEEEDNLNNETGNPNSNEDDNNDTTNEENEEEENLNNETGNPNSNEDDNNDTTNEENEEENLNNETGNPNPNEDDNNDTTDEENEEEDNLNNETGNPNPNEDDNNDTTDEENEEEENLNNETGNLNPIDDVNNDTTDEENEEEENLNNETGNPNSNEDDNNDTTDEENEEEENLNNETGNLNPNEDDNNDTTDEENEEEDNLNNETGNLNPNEDDNNDTTDEENEEEENLNNETGNLNPNEDDNEEVYILFRDLDDNGQYYAPEATLDKFGIYTSGSPTEIDGMKCYKIDNETANNIIQAGLDVDGENTNNSPRIRIEVRDVHLKREVITIYRDLDDNNQLYASGEIFKRFGLAINGRSVDIEGEECFRVDNTIEELINKKAKDSNIDVQYKDVHLKKKNETVYLYRDLDDNNQIYASQEVLERFGITPSGDVTKIEDFDCYKIDEETDRKIHEEAANLDHVVDVQYKDVHLKKKNETVYLYRDLDDNNQIYASQEVLERFGITPSGDVTKIEDFDCYKIDEETDRKIHEEAANLDPVVDVQYKDVHLKKKTETVIIYRDTSDNGQLYLSDDDCAKYGIASFGDTIDIEGKRCRKITAADDKKINEADVNVQYKDVSLKKKAPKPAVDAIIAKITDGVEIPKKTGQRYQASNIKVAKQFRNELHSGKFLYNVVHFVPGIVKAGFSLLAKIGSKILLGKKGRKAAKTINDRLYGKANDGHDITEDELEVLFNEYKGSRAKAAMLDDINPLLLDRLRTYAKDKVEKINEQIVHNYKVLFGLLEQIKKLTSDLNSSKTDNEKQLYMSQLKGLYEAGASCVKKIIPLRNEANNILSSGIHGIEEDFKAVHTKMSYVGLRFAKRKKIDGELLSKLGDVEQKLNNAIYEDDFEEIVKNFMKHERLYLTNTEIKNSIFGKRSAGSKYYSPLPEEFDYRDDPFIKDLVTTGAVVASCVNFVNSIRTAQLNAQAAAAKNAEINKANSANNAMVQNVHSKGAQIEGYSDTFREGINAQLHEDPGYLSGMMERRDLDVNGWTLNGNYYSMDAKSHSLWNNLNTNNAAGISKINSQLASGSISSADALQQSVSLVSSSRSVVTQVVNSIKNDCIAYAKNHPSFDLNGVIDSLNYVSTHPNALVDMAKASSDVVNIGHSLTTVAASYVKPLAALHDTQLTALFSTIGTLGLAQNILRNTQHKTVGKNHYGNSVTEGMSSDLAGMFDEVAQSENQEENQNSHGHNV